VVWVQVTTQAAPPVIALTGCLSEKDDRPTLVANEVQVIGVPIEVSELGSRIQGRIYQEGHTKVCVSDYVQESRKIRRAVENEAVDPCCLGQPDVVTQKRRIIDELAGAV